MKFIVFDTETTGLPKSKYAEPEDTWQFPYVVQLSWLIFNTGTNKIETVRDKIIKLPNKIPPYLEKIFLEFPRWSKHDVSKWNINEIATG